MEVLGRTVLYPFHRCESETQTNKMIDGFLPSLSLSFPFLTSFLLFLLCPGSLLCFPSHPLHSTLNLFQVFFFFNFIPLASVTVRKESSEAGICKRSFGQSFKKKSQLAKVEVFCLQILAWWIWKDLQPRASLPPKF